MSADGYSLNFEKGKQDDHEDNGGSSRSSVNEYFGFDDNIGKEVQGLARTVSRASVASADLNDGESLIKYLTHMSGVPGVEPFVDVEDKLNPDSDSFDAKFWVKNMRKLMDSDPEYYQPSSLGVAYRNLRVSGVAAEADYQPTVANAWLKYLMMAINSLRKDDASRYFDILKPMDGILKPGEVTVVLGRPGSGCSTLLKTIAAQTYGFKVQPESVISYDGISQKDIEKRFRGDVIYSAETDVHFPHLTVGDTLDFASRLRTPRNRGNISRETYARHMSSVYMAMYGLSHTRNTRVGDDFVRGVSGGERKRVSIAEASLCRSNVQCWDNATRGLDSATALEFIKALKTSAAILDATPMIAIYQCSQDAYDLFDNVVLLFEGRQIYFGKADRAKQFFLDMGYDCPDRQTTADYLTSLTNPAERVVRKGFENKIPRTAEEFESYWKNSTGYKTLIGEIDAYISENEKGEKRHDYQMSHNAKQAKTLSKRSPFTVSFFMQTRYIAGRNFLRVKGNPSITVQSIIGQLFMGLVLSSVFYNLKNVTSSFYFRGSGIFFALLFNAFASLLEIISLFEARPIVEKHKKFALYRPSADALASIATEFPTKVIMSMAFNFPFYFMVNLRRNPGRFFFYWFTCMLTTLCMSHLFRSIGAISTSIAQAMTPATALLLAMVIFTGFVIPTPYMLGWSRWINYLNPVGYGFESLMANEFHHREFTCDEFVPTGPGYENISADQRVCAATGSRAGSPVVAGTEYIGLAYEYYNAHKWRNIGILFGFVFFFLFVYVCLTEFNKGAMQKGEMTLYLKGSLKKPKIQRKKDIEAGEKDRVDAQDEAEADYKQVSDYGGGSSDSFNAEDAGSGAIFHWRDLTYQVKIKSEHRVILNHVDGWVKPGQITALMGSSGAGKTTLLNCLSERVTSGIVTDGVRMVDGRPLDSSFQRSIGYCQQQDIHLQYSTVREALQFSAYLRQPRSVSIKEKNEYVDYIIDLLEMSAYADALVGVAGEGLNVEQRKRLTIGVELAAKPKLLVFLDEPTSGLDSQTAWSICKLMRKLADHGQAILCTIHQPSAILLKEFDRLLFLQKGGETVYFGDLGEGCSTLINYFESKGAHPCPKEANPAEWMLEVVGAAPGSRAKQNYHEVWRSSNEFKAVNEELDKMEVELAKKPQNKDADSSRKYAASIWTQYYYVTKRAFQQVWRNPMYIYSKIFLCVSSSIFNGFSFFKANNSMQGLQNQMFSVFMFLMPFATLVQQMLPQFVKQRDVYEVREAPSRTFSWFAFICAQMTSEIPFQVFIGTLSFFCWYYPVGLYRNAEPTDQVDARGVLMWLFLTAFYVYTITMGHLCMSFNELVDNAANLATTMFTFCLLFCGVMAPADFFPGFWIFMYRCSPFTYLIQGALATGVANTKVVCADRELVSFEPPSGQTCGEYMRDYISQMGGYLSDPSATDACAFCRMDSTNQFLATIDVKYSERWRNWGIFISFIAINMVLTVIFYWLARVPKGNREKKK